MAVCPGLIWRRAQRTYIRELNLTFLKEIADFETQAVRYTATPPTDIASSAAGEGAESSDYELRIDIHMQPDFKQDLERWRLNHECRMIACCSCSTCKDKLFASAFEDTDPWS